MNISIEEFAKVEMRVGLIVEASEVEGSEKLIREVVDFGNEKRIVFSGIKKWYAPETLVGKKYIYVVNLEPRKMPAIAKDEAGNVVMDENGQPKREYSQGMVMAVDGEEGKPVLLVAEEEVPVGARVR